MKIGEYTTSQVRCFKYHRPKSDAGIEMST